MADAKITALTEKTGFLDDADNFVIVDSNGTPTTKKITKATLLSKFTVTAKKGTAGTINEGEAVYITGYDSGTGAVLVELAKADSATTMPAIGLAGESFTDSSSGNVIVFGALTGQDTSAFSVGDALYIDDVTAGNLVNTKPDNGAEIQKVGTVLESSLAAGVIQISGAFRTNDLPNLAQDKVWVGDANGVPQEQDYSPYGSDFSQSADETTSTNATATYSQKLRHTTGSLPSGDYLINWQYEVRTDGSDKEHEARVQLNDTTTLEETGGAHKVSGTTQSWIKKSGFYYAASISGVQNIDIDFRAPAADTTAELRRARIYVHKVN